MYSQVRAQLIWIFPMHDTAAGRAQLLSQSGLRDLWPGIGQSGRLTELATPYGTAPGLSWCMSTLGRSTVPNTEAGLEVLSLPQSSYPGLTINSHNEHNNIYHLGQELYYQLRARCSKHYKNFSYTWGNIAFRIYASRYEEMPKSLKGVWSQQPEYEIPHYAALNQNE